MEGTQLNPMDTPKAKVKADNPPITIPFPSFQKEQNPLSSNQFDPLRASEYSQKTCEFQEGESDKDRINQDSEKCIAFSLVRKMEKSQTIVEQIVPANDDEQNFDRAGAQSLIQSQVLQQPQDFGMFQDVKEASRGSVDSQHASNKAQQLAEQINADAQKFSQGLGLPDKDVRDQAAQEGENASLPPLIQPHYELEELKESSMEEGKDLNENAIELKKSIQVECLNGKVYVEDITMGDEKFQIVLNEEEFDKNNLIDIQNQSTEAITQVSREYIGSQGRDNSFFDFQDRNFQD